MERGKPEEQRRKVKTQLTESRTRRLHSDVRVPGIDGWLVPVGPPVSVPDAVRSPDNSPSSNEPESQRMASARMHRDSMINTRAALWAGG